MKVGKLARNHKQYRTNGFPILTSVLIILRAGLLSSLWSAAVFSALEGHNQIKTLKE